MRPPKVVLCVATDERRLRERAFLLRVRGYQVLRAQSAEEALAELRGTEKVDVVMLDLPLERGDPEMLVTAKQLHRELGTLVIRNALEFADMPGADMQLPSDADSPAEIVARVKMLAAKKRGPKFAAGYGTTKATQKGDDNVDGDE